MSYTLEQFIRALLGLNGNSNQSTSTPEPQANPSSPQSTMQEMINILNYGPAGMSAGTRANFGPANQGYSGGSRPVSGMTAPQAMPNNYTPVQPQPAPVSPSFPPMQTEPGPLGIEDLFIDYSGSYNAPPGSGGSSNKYKNSKDDDDEDDNSSRRSRDNDENTGGRY